MYHEITHSCGHLARHSILVRGFAASVEMEITRLMRRKCAACYETSRQEKATVQVTVVEATLGHSDLPPLSGSDRQVAWAETIRIDRLSRLGKKKPGRVAEFITVTDAKWWIDNRAMDLAKLVMRIEPRQ